jgi:EAL domain-containing protein (putative c-di-GMP-specific phosphodiesterase class I)
LEEIGFGGLKVSVNVSAPQISDKNLCNAISVALKKSGLAPSSLVIEITESVAMADVVESEAVLRAIRNLGVSLAIDDFGTGYSSLGYLKRFPISELKIDKSFFEGVPEDVEASTIARGIIALSHTLDLSVTAEGIESEDQVAFLQTHKCDIIQGYYYSQPLPVEDLETFLRQEASQKVAS